MSRLRVGVVLRMNVNDSYSRLKTRSMKSAMKTAGVCDDVNRSSGKLDSRWVTPRGEARRIKKMPVVRESRQEQVPRPVFRRSI